MHTRENRSAYRLLYVHGGNNVRFFPPHRMAAGHWNAPLAYQLYADKDALDRGLWHEDVGHGEHGLSHATGTNYRSKPNREEENIPCGVIIRRLRARSRLPSLSILRRRSLARSDRFLNWIARFSILLKNLIDKSILMLLYNNCSRYLFWFCRVTRATSLQSKIMERTKVQREE